MQEVFYYDYVTIGPFTYFLAATNKGLSFLGLQENARAAIFSLYPQKILVHNPKRLETYITELKEYFAGTRRNFDLPIDIEEFGTAFQRSVLQQITKIPYGVTVSYGDVAASLDSARSVRAVAHAIALNPVLIFIPSHRVILSNGTIGGYALGSKEKKRLIDLEKSNLHVNS